MGLGTLRAAMALSASEVVLGTTKHIKMTIATAKKVVSTFLPLQNNLRLNEASLKVVDWMSLIVSKIINRA